MFQEGELVIYGAHGVCRIVEQVQRLIDRKMVTYLALEPVGQGNSRFFVPAQNAAAMAKVKHILSRQELETILDSPEVRTDGWIRDENQRKQAYRELMTGGRSYRTDSYGSHPAPTQVRPGCAGTEKPPVR